MSQNRVANTTTIGELVVGETAYFRRDGFFYVWSLQKMVLYAPTDFLALLEGDAGNYIPITRLSDAEVAVPREHIDGIKHDFWGADKPPLESTEGYLRVVET